MSKSRTNRESSQNQQEYEPKEPPAWYKEAQRDRDLYEMLGINRDHPQGGIHKAMRKRSRVVHPDVNPEYRREAEEEFKEMQDAYEILNNPLWRSAYDAAPDHESGLDAVAILRGRNGGSRPGKARNWGQPGAAGAGAGAGGGTGGGRGTAAGAGAGAGAGGGTGGGRGTAAGAGAGA
ncbi:MAG: J domain-containing protein, partial [Candidatus Doudnabacteria bacterium]|nr:J domain-containing protein [Candidatus Doudnabacteria bacterium]